MIGSVSVVTVVGARPQFIKASAVSRAIARFNAENAASARLDEVIVHTGQHYDEGMSQVFFDELEIPAPRYNLGVGSAGHGQQTATMLERIEQVLLKEKPDWVLVYGDTNSTLAGALAAVQLHIRVAHVEAGLRSFNRRMPEEINRIMVDRMASLLLCPTRAAVDNLAREGITGGVRNVGDVMYDSVLFYAALAAERSKILSTLSLKPRTYFLATVHRAENTEEPGRLEEIIEALGSVDAPVILPLHPRTRKAMRSRSIEAAGRLRVIGPVSYLDMLVLEKNARGILTDSGGMQKEAYFLGVPCVTLRNETEWVELVQVGANFLAGCDRQRILDGIAWAARWSGTAQPEPLYGDGNASRAVVEHLTAEMPGAPGDPRACADHPCKEGAVWCHPV
ncbi:MAG: UDP-N-acetylglucosamine 2-epimerase (non-hydrolyzing) [Phycisphaerae bacterium]|nr:UDP-N-acetylglucosamine 2-epimerase (non-hydrolyzing) [Phycisphaerae bacterium]